MSLWTPGGEHPVDRKPAEDHEDDDVHEAHSHDDEDPLAGLTPEERERAMAMAPRWTTCAVSSRRSRPR